ncbi:MAG TPA: class I SAM-dependent methyltransferase, partial [Mucilaginibacter sp.]|nr:class I SAM-dependent methyltransferase [Mucilaginibacter sp.]
FLVIVSTIVSIVISFYIYDLSDIYKLQWLNKIAIATNGKIVNIHSGFDETSILLKGKFPDAELTVLDFYDPSKHTEISIKRARRAYPPYENTIRVNTCDLALKGSFADNIFVILAAHEIRNQNERNDFFCELRRILKHNGSIIMIEHLRDIPNFLAYSIGFFHFIPRSSWYKAFKNTDLNISDQFRITPFITIFILEKYGPKP